MVRKYILVFLVISLVGCKADTGTEQNKLLNGKWEVYSSEINNKVTRNLENAYFDFKEDNTVVSNVFEDNLPHSYKLEKDILSINTPEPLQLRIKNLTADSLQMEGQLRVFYMKFYLKKADSI